MAQCPDCNSVKIFSIPAEGDGVCSYCHGEGKTGFSSVNELITGEPLECPYCHGSRTCQTCGGSGVV